MLKIMHSWYLVYCYNALWCKRAVAQCTVESFGVAVFSPAFDDDPRLTEQVEDLTVEAFTIPILPGRDPGSIKAVLAPTALIQALTA